MQLQKIHFKNFKLFKEVTFVFNKQFNIIIGNNMTGKTSILEGIMAGMKPYLSQIGVSFGRNPFIRDSDIRFFNLENNRGIRDALPTSLECYAILNGQEVSWKSGKNKRKATNNSIKILKKVCDALPDNFYYPIIIYYPCDKTISPIEEYEPVKSEKNIAKHYEKKDFSEIVNWILTQKKEISKIEKTSELGNVLGNGHLKIYNDLKESTFLVENSIKTALSDIVDIFETKDLLYIELRDGRVLPISALSSGYKIIFAMVGDLAVRCVRINPHLGENAIKETNGLVLIDEIDQHLHPILQQQIVSILRNIFPKLQFIVTTHSPHVIASAEEGEVIILPNIENFDNLGGEIRAEKQNYKGWQLDYILKDTMNMIAQNDTWYNKILNPILDEINQAFEQKNLVDFEKGVAKLKVILNPNDPILASLEIQKIRLKLK